MQILHLEKTSLENKINFKYINNRIIFNVFVFSYYFCTLQ